MDSVWIFFNSEYAILMIYSSWTFILVLNISSKKEIQEDNSLNVFEILGSILLISLIDPDG